MVRHSTRTKISSVIIKELCLLKYVLKLFIQDYKRVPAGFSYEKVAKMAAPLHIQLLLSMVLPVIAQLEMRFTKYPESVIAPFGDKVTFECEVNVPGERFVWRWKPEREEEQWVDIENEEDGRRIVAAVPGRSTKLEVDVTTNMEVTLYQGNRRQIETPHGILVIHNATVEDSGLYSCRATNELSGDVLDVAQKIHLKVQHEGSREVRFLEAEDYVGVKDNEGVLTMPIKPNEALRLWCGAVSTPPPKITWSLEGEGILKEHSNSNVLTISAFTPANEGIYSCSANGIRRSWKVIALQPPRWEGNVSVATPNEGMQAHVSCGNSYGEPTPNVYWVLNSEVVKIEQSIKFNNTDLYIEHVQKRHAGIVQCFACNVLGCAYSAGMLSVVPLQISDQDYTPELPKNRYPMQPPKKHSKKNPRKHKAVLIPPSRPNVTRLSDESVMVSWTHDNQGLSIRFFKVQYKEVSNSSNQQWNTANQDIPPYIHSYQIDGLIPDKYYKFRIAAVYSNQDNKSGKSSSRFHLQHGGFKAPRAPVLTGAVPMSATSIQLDWNWSSGGEVEAEGFYVYYRAVDFAGPYEKVTVAGRARRLLINHLTPDTGYDIKLQAYTAQAASDFSAIKSAKTLRPAAGAITSTSPAPTEETSSTKASGGGALVTAGGAIGAAALLVVLATALFLCRRARRPTAHKEKGNVTESGGANGYIPAKVPITITANPMHSEGGDAGVEMSFLHNNNTGNNDDTLPHSRKNGPAPRQYV
ncbi:unnamed protein product [Arctia plantaginis]|uniref:Interference hedgehog n=1 Tax=Arctia plantaginis TaxID=874455 RepID=A0A8S1AM11_ARCPL|nr:unnamed protein product [Arctia plantaginis]